MFGKQLEKTKPLSLLFNLPGWMGDYPFNANMFFHCNNCSLQPKCLPPVAWVSQPSWLPCREGCLPRADFWHVRGGWEHLKKQNGKDVCSRRSAGRREKRTNHWQTSEEIYWNLLISCRHVACWKLGKERKSTQQLSCIKMTLTNCAPFRKHNFLTMSQGSPSWKLVPSKACPSADSLCDCVSTSRQMGLEVVSQHTRFAFDHLVPQKKRGSAGNTGKHMLRFRQKLVSMTKAGSCSYKPSKL